jgi:Type II secretion system (T2SS), protein M subtype b
MTLQPRDRRALALLAVAAVLSAIVYFWPSGSGTTAVVAPTNSVELAEKRLARVRLEAATVPGKEKILQSVTAQLAQREKGLIRAQTAAQAQAQLLEILRRLCGAESPPIEIRSTELGAIQPLGDAYGSAAVAVQIDCGIDQLVNLLSAIGAEPDLISTSEVRITSANDPKHKTVGVRLAVIGVVPRALIPKKKGSGTL